MKNATKARALIRHKEFVVRRVYRSVIGSATVSRCETYDKYRRVYRSVIGSATVSRCETYDKYLSRRFLIHR